MPPIESTVSVNVSDDVDSCQGCLIMNGVCRISKNAILEKNQKKAADPILKQKIKRNVTGENSYFKKFLNKNFGLEGNN